MFGDAGPQMGAPELDGAPSQTPRFLERLDLISVRMVLLGVTRPKVGPSDFLRHDSAPCPTRDGRDPRVPRPALARAARARPAAGRRGARRIHAVRVPLRVAARQLPVRRVPPPDKQPEAAQLVPGARRHRARRGVAGRRRPDAGVGPAAGAAAPDGRRVRRGRPAVEARARLQARLGVPAREVGRGCLPHHGGRAGGPGKAARAGVGAVLHAQNLGRQGPGKVAGSVHGLCRRRSGVSGRGAQLPRDRPRPGPRPVPLPEADERVRHRHPAQHALRARQGRVWAAGAGHRARGGADRAHHGDLLRADVGREEPGEQQQHRLHQRGARPPHGFVLPGEAARAPVPPLPDPIGPRRRELLLGRLPRRAPPEGVEHARRIRRLDPLPHPRHLPLRRPHLDSPPPHVPSHHHPHRGPPGQRGLRGHLLAPVPGPNGVPRRGPAGRAQVLLGLPPLRAAAGGTGGGVRVPPEAGGDGVLRQQAGAPRPQGVLVGREEGGDRGEGGGWGGEASQGDVRELGCVQGQAEGAVGGVRGEGKQALKGRTGKEAPSRYLATAMTRQ